MPIAARPLSAHSNPHPAIFPLDGGGERFDYGLSH